jgi:hypothetical protein
MPNCCHIRAKKAAFFAPSYRSKKVSFHFLRGFLGLFSSRKCSAPSNKKDPASFGKLDPSRIPRKQLDSELIFQIADL